MATVTDFRKELTALSTWAKQAAGLNSFRLSEAPQKVARPVILWETPSRGSKVNLETYKYKQTVRQYGKLFVTSVDQLVAIQDALTKDLEDRYGVIQVMEAAAIIGRLREAEITFDNGESLEVSFNIAYEVTYGRTRPAPLPAPTAVTNKVNTHDGGYIVHETTG